MLILVWRPSVFFTDRRPESLHVGYNFWNRGKKGPLGNLTSPRKTSPEEDCHLRAQPDHSKSRSWKGRLRLEGTCLQPLLCLALFPLWPQPWGTHPLASISAASSLAPPGGEGTRCWSESVENGGHRKGPQLRGGIGTGGMGRRCRDFRSTWTRGLGEEEGAVP